MVYINERKPMQVSIIRPLLNSTFFLFLQFCLCTYAFTCLLGCGEDHLSNDTSSKLSSNLFLDKKILTKETSNKEIKLIQQRSQLRRTPPSLVDATNEVLWLVKGELLFTDRLYDESGYEGLHTTRPVPQVKVELIKRVSLADGTSEEYTLDQRYTDTEGNFRLSWWHPPLAELTSKLDHQNLQLFFRAYSIQNTLEGHEAEVRSRNQSSLYELEVELPLTQFKLEPKPAQPWLPDELVTLPFLSVTSPEEGHLSAAFNILSATAIGFEHIRHYSDFIAPKLTILWDLDQAVSCGSCYSNDNIRLGGQVEDPDHYDDHIILHEMGHFLTDRWSVDDSPGGPHRGRAVHPSLAYGEGIAYFWSALVLRDPVIVDWMFPDPWVVDLERNLFNGMPMTWGTFAPVASTSDLMSLSALHHEELVSSLLWAMYQLLTSADSEWGELLIMNTLIHELPNRIDMGNDVGAIGIDLADFLDSFICTLGEDHGDQQLSQTFDTWLRQIEDLSRQRRYFWYWFNSREELCSQKGAQKTLKIQFVEAQKRAKYQSTISYLMIESMKQANHPLNQQLSHYELWLGHAPHSQMISYGECASLPCQIPLDDVLPLVKDQAKSSDLTHRNVITDAQNLSLPLIVILKQADQQQQVMQWRGSWLSKTYLQKQAQKLSFRQRSNIEPSVNTTLSEQGILRIH